MVKKLPPDNRLDWRDPDMPVWRYAAPEGSENWSMQKVPSRVVQRYHAGKMDSSFGPPDWRNDESYFWNRRNKPVDNNQ